MRIPSEAELIEMESRWARLLNDTRLLTIRSARVQWAPDDYDDHYRFMRSTVGADFEALVSLVRKLAAVQR